KRLKNGIQTIIYIPHFMSWVIILSITYVFLNVDGGVLNEFLATMGFEKIRFLTSPEWTRTVYIGQVLWKELCWSTIIYLSAITAVHTQLY
ncbi:sugar ABC transporter permease, partial [Enterococcus faecium]